MFARNAHGSALVGVGAGNLIAVQPMAEPTTYALTGLDVEQAVQLVRRVRLSLPATATAALPGYELWRLGVQHALASEKEDAHDG